MIEAKEDTALKIAEYLLQIKAIIIRPNEPFTWASGWKSPIYCDNRKALSHPAIRTHIRQKLGEAITSEFGNIDAIVGIATAGIAQGVLVAEELGLPFAYVRPKPKEHGLKNQIEGDIQPGSSVAVIEDLVSTGGSSLKAIAALKDNNCDVKGLVTIFSYNFKIAKQNFKEAKIRFVSLCDYDTLIKQAKNSGYIDKDDIKTLKAWRDDPENWGQKVGTASVSR
ncbi:orotate phosphoribosyltransferase [Cytophagaceae bacterium AH-315-L13]|nr:orotate phosphoribosyltransferase [Cytophagaceae bacterium AH-315-L13]